jgi:hypothetical protein
MATQDIDVHKTDADEHYCLEQEKANRTTPVGVEYRSDKLVHVEDGHERMHELDIVSQQLVAQAICWDSQRILPCQILHVVGANMWRQGLDVDWELVRTVASGRAKARAASGGAASILIQSISAVRDADLVFGNSQLAHGDGRR